MIREPGVDLDFSTFIAYLIPGYLIELLLLLIWDSFNVLRTTGKIVITTANWTTLQTAVVVALSALGAYILGLLFDTIAHHQWIAGAREQALKHRAYTREIHYFEHLLKSHELKESLCLLEDAEAPLLARRNALIDALFYRFASPEIWARQNWHWAFYEFTRQLFLVMIPLIPILTFYVCLRTDFLSQLFLPVGSLLAYLALAGGIAVINWFTVVRFFRETSDGNCTVYYRHRVWVVLAHLLNVDAMSKAQSKSNQD